MQTCAFCSEPANSKEHLYPAWLRQYVPAIWKNRTHEGSELLRVSGALQHANYRRTTRPGDPTSQRLRVVCKSCNNTWMSTLQSAAKPVLAPLIQGVFNTLTSREMAAISLWVAMFTMVAEFKHRPTMTSSQKEREQFRRSMNIPEGWHISIGRYGGEKWHGAFNHIAGYIQFKTNQSKALSKPGPEGHISARFQSTTFTLGRVLLHSASCTETSLFGDFHHEHQEFAEKYGLTPIYPTSSNGLDIAENLITDNLANELSNGFLVDQEIRSVLRQPT